MLGSRYKGMKRLNHHWSIRPPYWALREPVTPLIKVVRLVGARGYPAIQDLDFLAVRSGLLEAGLTLGT
jgi:hypothetical protein